MWKCSALSRGREVRVRLVSKQNETRPISFTFSNCHCYDLCYDECEFYVAFPDDVIIHVQYVLLRLLRNLISQLMLIIIIIIIIMSMQNRERVNTYASHHQMTLITPAVS